MTLAKQEAIATVTQMDEALELPPMVIRDLCKECGIDFTFGGKLTEVEIDQMKVQVARRSMDALIASRSQPSEFIARKKSLARNTREGINAFQSEAHAMDPELVKHVQLVRYGRKPSRWNAVGVAVIVMGMVAFVVGYAIWHTQIAEWWGAL